MITVQNVSKAIASRAIVQDVSFTVPNGSITGFVGPNGAGKTTTMRVALGLTRADNGDVRFDGVEYRDLPMPLQQVGSLLDARWLIPNLRAREVLDYSARTQGVQPRSNDLLALVGLADAGNRRVAQLSLGMRQRLGIAVALIASPRHLILDEPLNGLDPTGITWLRDLLRRLRSEGCAVLLSSHIITELALIADNIVVIAGGRIVRTGPLSQLVAEGEQRVLARTDRPDELVAAVRAQLGDAEYTPGAPVSVTGLTARDVFQLAAAHEIVLDELTSSRSTLDDIYLESVGETTHTLQETI